MSAGIREFKGSAANGTIESGDGLILDTYVSHFASITFYTDDTYTTPVIFPTAGTVQFEASEDGYSWGQTGGGVANDGLIDVTAAYLRPNLIGSIKKMRVTLAGITGASHFIVRIASSTGV